MSVKFYVEELMKALNELKFSISTNVSGSDEYVIIDCNRAKFLIDKDGVLVLDKSGDHLHELKLTCQDDIEAVLMYHWY